MQRRIMRPMASISTRLSELGLTIPAVPGPFGAYVPAKRVGNLVFVAGQLPAAAGKVMATGQVPSRASVGDAQRGARQCVLNGLAAAATVVPIDDLVGVVRVGVFVSSDPAFHQQPQVANAASELLKEIFGDAGQHARAAVGAAALPMDATVEIEFIFEVR
jgi:enamine deaminase RidA (YjgF/YER057c/UK114 family)